MLPQNLKESSEKHTLTGECNICLQSLNGQYIQCYCDCTGSQSDAHQRCLLEWLNNSQQNNNEETKISYYCCRLCKSKVYLITSNNYFLKGVGKICKEICQNQSYFDRLEGILSIFLLLILIVSETVLIVMNVTEVELSGSMVLVATIYNSLLLTVCFIYFVCRFVVGVKRQIFGLKRRKEESEQINKTVAGFF